MVFSAFITTHCASLKQSLFHLPSTKVPLKHMNPDE